jgi:hypothetical protein
LERALGKSTEVSTIDPLDVELLPWFDAVHMPQLRG